jgi:hypothetical protein
LEEACEAKERAEKKAREEREAAEKKACEEKEAAEREKKKKKLMKVSIPIIIAAIGILAGIIAYNSQQNSVTIPDSVTTVKDGEFARKQLINVEIPDGVTSIGNNAFKRNKLTGVVIPASVTSIGDNAFARNQFTSITIGANVTIGTNAFEPSFMAAYSSNDMGAGTYRRPDTKSAGWSVWHGNFQYQNNNKIITIIDYDGIGGELVIPAQINGNEVKIGMQVFMDKNLTSVSIGNGVTSIGVNAFAGNNLTGVAIPNSVTYIADSAFSNNQLTSVSIPNRVRNIGDSAFSNNQLTSVSIGNGVMSIGVNAFADNPITSIRIGTNVILGSEPESSGAGVLGRNTGFNSAYTNNNSRAGTYTRPSTNSTTWTRR